MKTRLGRNGIYDFASVESEGPFGELIRATGSKAEDFNFRFSTKYQDAETGLLYYGFRYYDAETGRWLSRDPIGESGGLNLYGMVGNNPITRWDYLGLAGPRGGGYQGLTPSEIAWSFADGWAQGGRNVASVFNQGLVAAYNYPKSLIDSGGATAAYLIYDPGIYAEEAEMLYGLAELFATDPCFRASVLDELGQYLSDADNQSKLLPLYLRS